MSGPVCIQCGQPLAEGARFCGQCGATQSPPAAKAPAQTLLQSAPIPVPAAAPAAGAGAGVKQTMLGFASPLASAAPARVAPAPEPAVPKQGAAAGKKTMLGVASPMAMGPAPAAAGSGPGARPAPAKTMLGVAIPGIAPVPDLPTAPAPLPPAGAAPEAVAEAPLARRAPAMTVAMQVDYVPPPAPLDPVAAPPPPVLVAKRGVPLAMVAMGTAGVLVVGGVVLALLWKSAPPIRVQVSASADGKDVLHLTCDPRSCADGTTAELDGAKATFAHGEADLVIPTPLHLGANDLALHLARPGMGRDETVKLAVPVAYRVRADVTTMSAPRPSITIRVEAQPGADVRLDGKPLALDADGAGAYAVDESAATEGPADESRVVSADSKYVVTPKGGAPENGTVSARVAVAPLRVDAPCAKTVVDEDQVLVAGRGPKGADVTVDGQAVTPAADGSFQTSVALPAAGDHTIEVRAGTTALMPRTVHVAVQRVASLADAAASFERQPTLGYDAAMGNLAAAAGRPIVVQGTIVDARGSGHRTLLLVDDRRGCARGPCLARVVVGRDMALARGDGIKAYALVTRAFTTPGGQTVPEVESEFVIKATR